APSAAPGRLLRFFLEKGDDVLNVVVALESAGQHLGAGNGILRALEELRQARIVPGHVALRHRVRILEACGRPRLVSDDAAEARADPVLPTIEAVASLALGVVHLLAGRHIAGGERLTGRYGKRKRGRECNEVEPEHFWSPFSRLWRPWSPSAARRSYSILRQQGPSPVSEGFGGHAQ